MDISTFQFLFNTLYKGFFNASCSAEDMFNRNMSPNVNLLFGIIRAMRAFELRLFSAFVLLMSLHVSFTTIAPAAMAKEP